MQCDLCGSAESALVLEERDLLLDRPSGCYSVRRCLSCGLYRLDPQPDDEELRLAYSGDYFRRASCYVGPTRWAVRLLDWMRSSSISSLLPDGAVVLDVGCGDGSRLAGLARSRPWRLRGVEPDEQQASQAKARGVDVYNGFWEDAPVQDESVDALLMHHVLEHLRRPRAGLVKCLRVLRPGGLLIIDVPNAGSLERRAWGRFWIGWDLPRHLYAFSTATLPALVSDVGFSVDAVNHQALPIDWVQSLQLFLCARRIPPQLVGLFGINNFVLVAMFQPAAILGKLLRRSGRIQMIARKPDGGQERRMAI